MRRAASGCLFQLPQGLRVKPGDGHDGVGHDECSSSSRRETAPKKPVREAGVPMFGGIPVFLDASPERF